MYQYDHHDQTMVDQRVAEFRAQTGRFLDGELSEDQFKSLRLMNGLYQQLHAPMLRIAIPYGELSADQVRKLAHIARAYDRGYGHITTRQNIQFNWPVLESVPDILQDLAAVQMHGIQSSGNCIRNITSDHLAGINPDEVEDPRPYCEIIRQWSTFHPEFSYLPRKFKIAVTGTLKDRAVSQFHDIGLQLVRNQAGNVGFKVFAGGGQGRTPIIGTEVREFLDKEHLLTYLEAILRVYNLLGRRDNKYKARIKILVKSMGAEKFIGLVEDEWESIKQTSLRLDPREIDKMRQHFVSPPLLRGLESHSTNLKRRGFPEFPRWVKQNTLLHKKIGYRVVTLSLKSPDSPPGDITADQLDAVADLSERYSFGEVRTTHTQNLVLPHVMEVDLFELWKSLDRLGLATPNISTLTDIICCPGLDFCSLANTTSIPLVYEINQRFSEIDKVHALGDIQIKISGCMNACGHHHVGHIGILGVDKKGEEWYQVTLGGSASGDARIGQRLGPAFSKNAIVDAIERILDHYVAHRANGESFVQLLARSGIDPFKQAAYTSHSKGLRAQANG